MGALSATDTAPLLAAAGRAADALVARAIGAGGRTTWLGAVLGAPGEYRTGDPTLYDGSAGIALAAWPVAAALGRDDLADLALGAARHAVASQDGLGCGLFDGRAGVGLAALELGAQAGDARLRADGLATLRRVAGAAVGDADLIGGSAGIVLALLAAWRRTGDARLCEAAVRHGEHLLAAAERLPWGWSWPPGLCGLAHGAAGVAWALGELAAATGDDRFPAGVDGARRFERSWFQPAENGWPDLRPETSPPGGPLVCPALWCHGATGIGLARLALFDLAPHPALAGEAAAALQAATAAATLALRHPAPDGLTLCHGLGGTVLLLLAAHRTLGEPEHLDAARWVAARALDRLGPDPAVWPSGVPGGGFSPGLMTGLAGVMYALTRAADPDAVAALGVLGDR